jgi:uncharacterized protein (DUF1810 family)
MLGCCIVEDEFEHFLKTQAPVYNRVVQELSTGQKRTHWMWFIFPQLQGLGQSPMARMYAIQSLEQARRYAQHPELGLRLRHCTRLVTQIQGRSISEIFDFPDDLKFHSSITLFALAVPEDPVFKLALEKYFGGQKDEKTVSLLQDRQNN